MNTEQINNLIDTCQQEIKRLQQENKQLKEVIDNIKRFCTSNEWGKYYEISSCRNHILEILKEVE